MEPALIAPLMLYGFVCSATPGPNNIMLASSGLAFGLRRTVPHMLGICFGCAAMLGLSGLGLGAAFEAWPPCAGQSGSRARPIWCGWRLSCGIPTG